MAKWLSINENLLMAMFSWLGGPEKVFDGCLPFSLVRLVDRGLHARSKMTLIVQALNVNSNACHGSKV